MVSYLAQLVLGLLLALGGLTVGAAVVGQSQPHSPYLAFLASSRTGYHVYLLDIAHSLPLQLNREAVDNCCLEPAPDGVQVVLSGDLREQPNVVINRYTGQMELVENLYGLRDWAQWSPDGTQVIYNPAGLDLWMKAVNGSRNWQLTHNGRRNWDAVWSWDGAQVAFLSNFGHRVYRDEQSDLYVMSASGSHLKRLTFDDAYHYGPAWSPDGIQIVYAAGEQGKIDLFIIDVNSGAIRALTTDPSIDSNPVWSPDGQDIAFISNREGQTEIYLIAVDGSNLRRLTYTERFEGVPLWIP